MTDESKKPPVSLEKLLPGTRREIEEDGSLVRIVKGSVEVYAVATAAKSYRQIFLLELSAGELVFPAIDTFSMTKIFVYAKTEVLLETGPREFTGNLQPAGVEGLRRTMQQWFRQLIELPWLKFLADRGDDMLMLWDREELFSAAATEAELWEIFLQHQEILALLIGARFRLLAKQSDTKLSWRREQHERLLQGAVDNLLEEDALAEEAESISTDTKMREAVYVVRRIAAALHMKTEGIHIAEDIAKKLDQLSILRRLIQKGGMQLRLISLEKNWYTMDCGVMMGYYGPKKEVAALLPVTAQKYQLVTQAKPEGIPITAEVAEQIDKDAFVCYGGFPARKLKIRDLLKFMFNQCWRDDYKTILLASLLGGLIPIFSPIVTETIFSDILPIQDRQGLATVTQVMMVVGFSTAGVSLVRSIAVLRISAHLDMTTEAALWNRLLSLPTKFFRDFQTGELLQRMGSLNAIKGLVTGDFVGGVFNFIFSFWSLFLMCYYSMKLTLAAIAVWLVYALVIAVIYRRVFSLQRNMIQATNKVAGQVQEIFNGLPKFRVQGAEARAYYLWSKVFGEEWKWNLKLRWQGNYNGIIGSIQPFILTMLLFYTVVYGMRETVNGVSVQTMGYAQFMGFNAAYGSFNGTMIAMVGLATGLFSLKPHIENLKPILEAEPEITEDKVDAEVLAGSIEVSHVSFAYKADGPEVLRDISFRIRAGETVAIVGRSGCGKSTLIRLLLGFETPKSGAVYFDGQDMAELNVSSVRSQMGVVLQNGQLMSGDIFTNIVGTSSLTMDDAWLAAERAGIADDIREMPMGMYTIISEGSGNISGGQRQRLLIARALANKPAIVLLDEATSALDNRTQAIVTQSLSQMHCTRVIVAHRLTTIRDADRILVMDGGSIVENGTYEELAAMDGLFAKLIQRQVA